MSSKRDGYPGRAGSAPYNSIKLPNVSILNVFYKNFQHLSDNENQTIFDVRDKLNTANNIIYKCINASAIK